MFWSEYTEAKALTNLRLTLHRLRQALEQVAPGASAVLIITRQTVQLKHTAFEVDAVRFQALLAESAAHPHQDIVRCEQCLARLSEAAKLYNGELLAGFGLADAPAFEEWLLLHRETLHQQALMALHVLATAYEQRGDDYQAHLHASRQLTLEPSRESAHRQIMRTGELLASGGASHTLQLWDIAPRDQRLPSERKLSSILRGHTDLVDCVRFSRDGCWLASSSADETIRL